MIYINIIGLWLRARNALSLRLILLPVIDPYTDRNSWQLDQASEEEIEVEISTNRWCAKENAIIHQCIDEP